MSVLVAVFDDGIPPGIPAGTARALSRLGVTDVALTEGPDGSAVVISGWSFDGRRHECAVVELVARGRPTRVLHGIADVVLRPDTSDAEKFPA